MIELSGLQVLSVFCATNGAHGNALGVISDGSRFPGRASRQAAARRLGTSLRTYRRRVAELMAALEAGSRFQAGVRAGELGLAH